MSDLDTALAAAESAAASANSAASSAEVASTTITGAVSVAADAAAAATNAAASESNAASSATAAAASQTAASTSATNAGNSATAAATSATNAATSKTGADTAKTAAETARDAAATARTGAETAQTGAQTARTGAETARTGAETARTAAEAAAVEAQNAAGGGVTSLNGSTGAITLNQDTLPDGTTNRSYTQVEKTKLSGVATGATANATDAQLRDRSTHTGTQAASTITGLATVATTGSAANLTGTLPTSVLPPLAINETFTAASQTAMLALTAQRGDMAIRTDTSRTYVLSTDSPSTLADWKEVMAAGQVTSVSGKTGTVSLVKGDVGLGNVDNTSDLAKPISTATQTALDGKSATTHIHDDRYYTETETNTLLAGKAPTIVVTGKTFASRPEDYQVGFSLYETTELTWPEQYGTVRTYYLNINRAQQYYTAKVSSKCWVRTADSGQTSGWTAWKEFSFSEHTHDDRYYTETETNTLLAGKSDTTHNHDTRYYTETEVDTFLAAKANSTHVHSAADITSGTLADARLSANVPLENATNVFTGTNTFSGSFDAPNSGISNFEMMGGM